MENRYDFILEGLRKASKRGWKNYYNSPFNTKDALNHEFYFKKFPDFTYGFELMKIRARISHDNLISLFSFWVLNEMTLDNGTSKLDYLPGDPLYFTGVNPYLDILDEVVNAMDSIDKEQDDILLEDALEKLNKENK